MSDNTASSNLLLTKLILTFAQLALRLPHAMYSGPRKMTIQSPYNI